MVWTLTMAVEQLIQVLLGPDLVVKVVLVDGLDNGWTHFKQVL